MLAGIVGRVVLDEPWGISDAATCICALGGVFLIARPWETVETGAGAKVAGVMLSVIAAIFSSICMVILRQVGKAIETEHNVLYFHMPNMILSVIISPFALFETRPWIFPTNLSSLSLVAASTICGIAGKKQ